MKVRVHISHHTLAMNLRVNLTTDCVAMFLGPHVMIGLFKGYVEEIDFYCTGTFVMHTAESASSSFHTQSRTH
jgi:hypothetical protein